MGYSKNGKIYRGSGDLFAQTVVAYPKVSKLIFNKNIPQTQVPKLIDQLLSLGISQEDRKQILLRMWNTLNLGDADTIELLTQLLRRSLRQAAHRGTNHADDIASGFYKGLYKGTNNEQPCTRLPRLGTRSKL